MKRQWLPLAAILLALVASACSSDQAIPEETTLSEIYTAVAITVAAPTNIVTPMVTSMPTHTPAPTSTMAFASTATPTPLIYPASYVTSSSCNSSAYVSDVTIDDGTELAPGESFTKTWDISNNGTCNWSRHYTMVFVSGDDMDGEDTEIYQKVESGETAEVSVELMAPDEEGTYTGYWSLADASGNLFGQKVYVQIVVSEDVATSTPTDTLTPTVTASDMTSTATSTPVPATAIATATATPTASPTPVLDATSTETPGG